MNGVDVGHSSCGGSRASIRNQQQAQQPIRTATSTTYKRGARAITTTVTPTTAHSTTTTTTQPPPPLPSTPPLPALMRDILGIPFSCTRVCKVYCRQLVDSCGEGGCVWEGARMSVAWAGAWISQSAR